MTYNPAQSKPYIFFQNNEDSQILDPNNLPSYQVDYPLDINVDFALDLKNGAGDLNTVTHEMTFHTNTFLFADTMLFNNKSEQEFRTTTIFTDNQNNLVGIRGNDLGRNPRNTDATSASVMNSSPRSTQRSDEFPRLMAEPNKKYKLRFGVLQHDISSSRWTSTLKFISPAKTTTVFGFVL